MLCFDDLKKFEHFRRVYQTAIILFHFVLKIESIMNKSNTQDILKIKLDRLYLI